MELVTQEIQNLTLQNEVNTKFIQSYQDLLMLVSIGVLGGSAGILFIYAYRLIEASKLAVFEYLAIPPPEILTWAPRSPSA